MKAQIAVAMGEPLRISQEEVTFTGHAIECRINAENPYADFAPSPAVWKCTAPGARACGWTATCTPATPCRIMIPWWPN